jgi:hypothetical protein
MEASHPRIGRAVREKDEVVPLTLNSLKAFQGKMLKANDAVREDGKQS